MGRRKGELSPSSIDRGWPHQVSLPEDECTGMPDYDIVRLFAEPLSVCSRGHRFRQNDRWYHVFCFQFREDAEKFKDRFGGEWFDPARRGRGKGMRRYQLREPKKRYY
ncbi:hypothetical protein RHPLAN_63250 [Rhodoplanes sp. Z2-YC6860]|nr:hypothetical protein RHPLAN_63250 [Rhodoplanes sp. Z2-YC6860]